MLESERLRATQLSSVSIDAILEQQQLLSLDWGRPIGANASREIYTRPAKDGFRQAQMLQGRVRGESTHVLRLLLCDHHFKRWRDPHIASIALTDLVVPEQLWAQTEVVDLGVSLLGHREFRYLTAQAELGNDIKVLVEQCCHDVAGSRTEAPSTAPPARRLVGVRLSPVPGTDEVEVRCVTQLALGTSVPSHFHAAFLDERAELVDALNTYLALPEWPEIREELLKRGPRLLARAKEPTHSAPDATAPVVGIKRHDQLHLAQVHTFANINRGLSPEDQGFMRPILGSQHGSQERSLDGAS